MQGEVEVAAMPSYCSPSTIMIDPPSTSSAPKMTPDPAAWEVAFVHTEVPAALEGHRLGGKLARPSARLCNSAATRDRPALRVRG